VNNAAMRRYSDILGTTEQSWDEMLGTNVKGYAFCAKYAIPVMKDSGGGSIVNVASIRSTLAGRNMIEYNTTKAAIVGLSGSLAYDHALDNIRVNTISPGPVFTRFHEERAVASGKTIENSKESFRATEC